MHVGRKQIGMIIGIVELLDCCQQDVISLKKIGGQLLCRSFFHNLNVKDCKYRWKRGTLRWKWYIIIYSILRKNNDKRCDTQILDLNWKWEYLFRNNSSSVSVLVLYCFLFLRFFMSNLPESSSTSFSWLERDASGSTWFANSFSIWFLYLKLFQNRNI